MGKSTISMAIFNSELLVYQRVIEFNNIRSFKVIQQPRSSLWPPIPRSPSPIPRGRWLQPDIRSYGLALRACQTSQQWQQALLLLWRAKKKMLQLMLGWFWYGLSVLRMVQVRFYTYIYHYIPRPSVCTHKNGVFLPHTWYTCSIL